MAGLTKNGTGNIRKITRIAAKTRGLIRSWHVFTDKTVVKVKFGKNNNYSTKKFKTKSSYIV